MLTDDWRSATFREDVGRWARAAAAASAWKRLKVAIFGYAMNEMGDIRVDESALVRTLGPAIIAVAQGDLYRGMQEAPADAVAEVIGFELVVAEGQNLDSQELPALEMPYGQFRPASGLRKCLNGWLTAGGPHHEVMNLGHRAAGWKVFCQMTGIEFVPV